MGWAFGMGRHPRTFKTRKIGYGVAAKCDVRGCRTRIDRGLAYLCGGLEGADGNGCGGYFCYEHLAYWPSAKHESPCEDSGYRCPACVHKEAKDSVKRKDGSS